LLCTEGNKKRIIIKNYYSVPNTKGTAQEIYKKLRKRAREEKCFKMSFENVN